MNEIDFEEYRAHLRGVAYRMLGSLTEADDAVQEAWLRLNRSDVRDVSNLGGWLTTVVARVCLDMLRSRESRAEEPVPAAMAQQPAPSDPESEAQLADSVGIALLLVLDTLEPVERLAFVLHDVFAVPFDEIASIVGRSPDAARQLASRARRRIQGVPTQAIPDSGLVNQRKVVSTFLAALRKGDMQSLLAVLDPDVVVRFEQADGSRQELRGAMNWAKGATAFSYGFRFADAALVDGSPGLVMALHGKLFRAVRFTFGGDGRIVGADVIAHRARLDALDLGVLA
ncbi:putative RNA polymerase sigma factor [Labilithrix luteola]|uniref:Putative RNA polymerase sigma factor n=1 Tax=Labilithrix luteola TaxID=1391654 RepID=A0A0K1Q4K9_9BACT|nr:sigma-70 family RNA polymerase sigma factor [Labilithrix luteola]AKV00325.1 putative RNA polymerase sigma factor [Labilithrix luteola]